MVSRGITIHLFSECLKLKHIHITNGAVVWIVNTYMFFVFYFRTTSIAIAMRMFLDLNLNTLHYFLPLF